MYILYVHYSGSRVRSYPGRGVVSLSKTLHPHCLVLIKPRSSPYSIPVEPASFRVCVYSFSVYVSTPSNINISATSGPIAIKCSLKHHWGGLKVAIGFGPDRIRTKVSMATNSSQRVIMGKIL